jgi:periplasmic protein TonB
MKRLVEILAFVALAVAVHLALVLRFDTDNSSEAGGQGGAAMVTIAAASASVETMVAEWEAPPKTNQTAPLPDPPDTVPIEPTPERPDTRPDLAPKLAAAISLPSAPENSPIRPELDLSTPPPPKPFPAVEPAPKPVIEPLPEPVIETMPDPVIEHAPKPIAELTPIAAPRPETVFEPVPDPIISPELTRPTPLDAEGRPTTSKRPLVRPETEVFPKPTSTPAPKQKKAKPAETARPASGASAAQTSAGSGGSNQAGAVGQSTVKTLGKDKLAQLEAVWGGKIRARIERQKRYPRGSKGNGRVVVRVTIARDGRVISARIAKSSGQAEFDKAAMSAISRAGRMPRAPKGLEQASYTFNLPMDFAGKK